LSDRRQQSVTDGDTRYITQDAQTPDMPSSQVEGDDDYDVIDDPAVSGYERLDKTTQKATRPSPTNPYYTGLGQEQTTDTPSSREYVGMKKLDADNNYHKAVSQHYLSLPSLSSFPIVAIKLHMVGYLNC